MEEYKVMGLYHGQKRVVDIVEASYPQEAIEVFLKKHGMSIWSKSFYFPDGLHAETKFRGCWMNKAKVTKEGWERT